jgi:hypothetical protein
VQHNNSFSDAVVSVPGVEGELSLVHPRIAAPVAEALGVASRRRLLLAASADCLALGLAGAGGAVEAFGQSEALTTRLRHIIQVSWVPTGSAAFGVVFWGNVVC